MFIGFIYAVTNNVNGKMYVGKTTKPFDGRWKKHLACARRGTGYQLHRAIRKHGEAAFTFEIVDIAFNESDLNRKECEYIQHEVTIEESFGYNLTFGGEGTIPNEVTRQRMSVAIKAAHARPEVKKRILESARESHARPEYRSCKSSAMKAFCAQPETKLHRSALMKAVWARPEAEQRRQQMKALAQPEIRKRAAATFKATLARTEVKEQYRVLWSDPLLRMRIALAQCQRREREFIATVAWG